ncbi:MAG: exodeoxyribonuclease VII small subunit [Bowdeniella nasicola]|nr:exodeoxyribonuclease VII small subunit [Bowdeniella nasicola]
MSDPHADVAKLSYEQAREELVKVVEQMEGGDIPLEQALSLWERGEALAARCESWLSGAREKLTAARERRIDAQEASDA